METVDGRQQKISQLERMLARLLRRQPRPESADLRTDLVYGEDVEFSQA